MKLDPIVLQFLRDLVVNNHREWFHDNKAYYDRAKEAFESFVIAQMDAIAQFDEQVKGLKAKDCTFRIHRDIRFSQDKTPYKIHFGAYMAKDGRKSLNAGYYTHIEPDGSLLAGGLHMPSKELLAKVRMAIYTHPEAFKGIINRPKFKQHFPEIYGEKLKGAPRGFNKDFEDIDLIKYQSYDFFKMISDDELISDDYFAQSIESFKILKPLNDYFNQVLSK
ncbi:MAG: DUF2461 domain-containing protein [Bacteroidales bacterium]|nr:DUF2461 domain-containing protein [Bacteroidales bacterium]